MTLNILGQEYEIIKRTNAEDPKLSGCDGYCEPFSKKLVINDFEPDKETVEKSELYKEKVLRHEILHAFLHESGLDSNSAWARKEAIVDWIAIQGLKLYKAWKEAGAVNDEKEEK